MTDRLHWESVSNARTPMLMVHGFLSSRAQWLRNVETLSGVCRPVLAELWGHGRSPAPTSPGAYLPDAYVAQFEAIRNALGVKRWFVCGQSLGASLTMRYVLTHPDRVIAHVFTNSSSLLANAELLAQRSIEAKASIANIKRDGMAAVEAYRVHPAKARRLPGDVYDALVADAKQIKPDAIIRFLEHTNLHASLRDRVHQSTCPSLLAVGKYEKRFAPLRAFAEATIPRLEVLELEAGHASNAEAWFAFNEGVSDFILRHSPDA